MRSPGHHIGFPFGNSVCCPPNCLRCDEIGDLDYAFDFHAAVDKRLFYIMVGLVDDGVRQWLISTNSSIGFLRRLLGSSDADEHLCLVNHIDSLLRGHDGTSSIRWYTLEEWNNPPDDSWTQRPSA